MRRLLPTRAGRAGALGALALAVIAAGADLLASDLPLAARVDGRLHLLPAVVRPAALRGETNQSLAARLGPDDWLIAPPIPYGPEQVGGAEGRFLAPPDGTHCMGTDTTGRDVAARVIHGTRTALVVGLLSVVVSTLLGLGVGALAGYAGGRVDAVLMRLVEVVMTFPVLLLVLTVQGLLARSSVVSMMLVIACVRWTDVARLVRAEVLRVRAEPHVLAARALGATPARVLLVHVLPHCLGPVLVQASFGVAAVVLLEGGLAYLGLGAPPPTATWGQVMREAHDHGMRWWLTLFPGTAILLTVTTYNLLGEGLRDALDPRRIQARE